MSNSHCFSPGPSFVRVDGLQCHRALESPAADVTTALVQRSRLAIAAHRLPSRSRYCLPPARREVAGSSPHLHAATVQHKLISKTFFTNNRFYCCSSTLLVLRSLLTNKYVKLQMNYTKLSETKLILISTVNDL